MIWMLALSFVIGSAHALVGGFPLTADNPVARVTVALGYQGHAFCSAVLVADDLAVTAAHCVRNSRNIEVLFEANVVATDKPRRRPVIGYEMAPGYDPQDDAPEKKTPSPQDRADFALVHFSGGLVQGYQAARILPDNFKLENGAQVVLAGYGHSTRQDSDQDPIGVLRAGFARIQKARFGATEVQVAANPGWGVQNAGGDSGGPALIEVDHELYVFGVCNWGRANEFSVFARVRSYMRDLTANVTWASIF